MDCKRSIEFIMFKRFLSLSPVAKGTVFFILALLMVVPWLGLTEFNTKGEPREAVVSMSMMQKENWVLPVNNDIDIPYKPMMYHWTGSLASLLNGGDVNEFTSRLPSALAFALLVGATCWFYSRYDRRRFAPALTAAILLTCFELHRSGVSARVDMTLTFWMVSAFFLLYRWWCRERSGDRLRFLYRIPWLAVLCMSAAMLSKGPVGILLPVLAMGIFMLLKREKILHAFLWMTLFALLASLLPLLWYYEAWLQGGDNFLELVMEENFGRMTGTMTYESHSNPWHYNFWITAAGFLPWTILALIGGIGMLVRKLSGSRNPVGTSAGKPASRRIRWTGSDLDLFTLVSLATVIIFFCLPSSKRSVYLMPAYPFIAWFAARWFIWLGRNGYARAIRAFGAVLAIVAILTEVAFLFIKMPLSDVVVFTGRKAAANMAMFEALRDTGPLTWILVALLFGCGLAWFVWKGKMKRPVAMLGAEFAMLFFLFVALDGGLQPALLNTKSLKGDAKAISEIIGEEPLYEFIEFGESATANKYHFFELDFYLDDRIMNFRRRTPKEGYLAIPVSDIEHWLPEFESEGYDFEKAYTIDRPARKEKINIYKFKSLR